MWDGIPENWGKGYYRDVPICKYVKLSRARQIRDLKRAKEKDPTFPYYFDLEAGMRVVRFIERLVQFDGDYAGQYLQLSDWQKYDIILPLFGWKKISNGKRRFRESDIFIPKKNGKTTLAAGVGAYMTVGDRERGAQTFCAASKEEQANIVWDACRIMLETSKLKKFIKAQKKSIYCSRLRSFIKRLGRDSKTQDGINTHCGIVDEYHAHPNANIRKNLKSSMGFRSQPLLFSITTYGYGEQTPCQAQDRYCRNILEGIIENENHFAYITTVDDPAKWDQEEEWYKANPQLGLSIDIERFREDFLSAKQRPDDKEEFLSKRLNIWVKAAKLWIDMRKYAACDGIIDAEKFQGQKCYGAFDLGLTEDLSAVALAFGDKLHTDNLVRDEKGGIINLPEVSLLVKYFCPEEGIERRSTIDGVPYQRWAEEGWILPTPGATTAYSFIRQYILGEVMSQFQLQELTGDQWQAAQLMGELVYDGLKMVVHPQTMVAMNLPCRFFHSLILDNKLKHGNNPVLRWNASNAVILRDGNENIKVMKNKSTDRVDGVVASAMAIGRLLIAPPDLESPYNDRGIYVG